MSLGAVKYDNILNPKEAWEEFKKYLIELYYEDYGEEFKDLITKRIDGTYYLFDSNPIDTYNFYKNNKISFKDWLKKASQDELKEVYEKLRLDFCRTGNKSYEMEKISQELGIRGAKEWFKNHPPNNNPNFRWTDANRWDKD